MERFLNLAFPEFYQSLQPSAQWLPVFPLSSQIPYGAFALRRNLPILPLDNSSSLANSVPPFVLENNLDWTLTAIIITSEGIKAHYVGFCKTRVAAKLPFITETDYDTGYAGVVIGGLRHVGIQIGENIRVDVWFKASGKIPDNLPDFEHADAYVSEFKNGRLANVYIITADKPIVAHQYLS